MYTNETDIIEKYFKKYDKLINSYLEKTKRLTNHHEDLKQEILFGFVTAVKKYENHNNFTGCVSMIIYRRIIRYLLLNLSSIENSELKYKIAVKAYKKCKNKLKKEPTPRNISKYYGVNIACAEYILFVLKYKNIIFDNRYIDVENCYNNNSMEDMCIKKIDTDLFNKKVLKEQLKKEHQEILSLKYGFHGECLGPTEISKIYGNSRQNIDSKCKRAINILSKKSSSTLKKFY